MSKSNHIYKLRNLGLPVISTMDEMSRETRVSIDMLRYLTYRTDFLYKEYKIIKKGKSKKYRVIAQPCRELKAIQGWILRNILDKLRPSPFSKGFEKGESILSNAVPHIGSNFILNIDLEDFFPSITSPKVFNVFLSLGYNRRISSILTNICTYKSRLPQGAPTSPKLANLVCSRLDMRIQGYAGIRGIKFTRYADDITLSAQTFKKIEKAGYFLNTIIPSEDFKINMSKTTLCGPRRQKKVTGLVVSHDRAGIGREGFRLIRSKIHKLFTGNNDNYEHVYGMLSYIYSVDKRNYRKIISYIEKLKKVYSKNIFDKVKLMNERDL